MIRTKIALGAVLALPLAASGAADQWGMQERGADSGGSALIVDHPAVCQNRADLQLGGAAVAQYECCWIFYGGAWWCIPC